MIPHVVRVEASFSLGRDVIGWRQSKTTGERPFAKKLISGSLLKPITGFWQALTPNWIP
jgi:hypothetical protein